MKKEEYIIKGFGMQLVETAGYAVGIRVAEARGQASKYTGSNYDSTKLPPTGKFSGTVPYWAQLNIPDGSYIVFNEDGSQKVIEYKGIVIDTCLIQMNMVKNIVKTPIQGKDGTVKEYISDGDYHINIKGVFTEANGIYPEDDVQTMKEICKAKASIKVVSSWLQQFDITDIVIEDIKWPQREGFYNTQIFEIQALSDMPIELFIQ